MSKVKTLTQIAEEYEISEKTLRRRIKKNELHIERGLIFKPEQKLIYEALGYPICVDKNRFREDGSK